MNATPNCPTCGSPAPERHPAVQHAADAEAARLLDDAYREGFRAGVTAYAYSSGEAWAENGVQYVGTTGRTLAEALERVEETHNYIPPSAR